MSMTADAAPRIGMPQGSVAGTLRVLQRANHLPCMAQSQRGRGQTGGGRKVGKCRLGHRTPVGHHGLLPRFGLAAPHVLVAHGDCHRAQAVALNAIQRADLFGGPKKGPSLDRSAEHSCQVPSSSFAAQAAAFVP